MLKRKPSDVWAEIASTEGSRRLGSAVVAHRGVSGSDAAPNSLRSLELAARYGFAAEVDVTISKRGQAFLFHGPPLRFGMGRAMARLDENLAGVDTLDAGLSVVAGKVPIIVELKNPFQACHEALVNCLEQLSSYPGTVFIAGFDPEIRQLKSFVRQVPVGLVTLGLGRPSLDGYDFVLVERRAFRWRAWWAAQDIPMGLWTYKELSSVELNLTGVGKRFFVVDLSADNL